MDTNDKIKIGAALVVIILVIIIVWRILGKIGLIESKEAKRKKAAVEDLRSSPYFDPEYAKGRSFKQLGLPVAETIAKQVYRAKGVFNDDEESVYAAFAKLKNKAQISEVAQAFQSLYKKDMQAYILGFLAEKEMEKLQLIINKLPLS
jgi:hypothetical protein